MIKTLLHLLFASVLAFAALAGQGLSAANQPAAPQNAQRSAPAAAAKAPDALLNDLLARVRAMAQKSDADIGRLRIEKWKADSASKKQSQTSADSIQRNLTAAVPDLLDQISANPNSLIAQFRLYRDLNALFDTFSALTESAGAFAPAEQYSTLSNDLTQLDQARQKLADRVDFLAGTNEAELVRLRARPATGAPQAPAAGSRIVVDDNSPAKKKHKSPAQ